MNKKYILKELKYEDVNVAHSIICWQVDYLKHKGINQYIEPYPSLQEYLFRQEHRYNFGLYNINKKNLAVIASVIKNYIPEGWKEYEPKDSFAWITSLFTAQNYKGNNLGYLMLDEIERYLVAENIKLAVLDCYINKDEFLVNYYKKIGYKEIIRKNVVYPVHTFKAALMVKQL